MIANCSKWPICDCVSDAMCTDKPTTSPNPELSNQLHMLEYPDSINNLTFAKKDFFILAVAIFVFLAAFYGVYSFIRLHILGTF